MSLDCAAAVKVHSLLELSSEILRHARLGMYAAEWAAQDLCAEKAWETLTGTLLPSQLAVEAKAVRYTGLHHRVDLRPGHRTHLPTLLWICDLAAMSLVSMAVV